MAKWFGSSGIRGHYNEISPQFAMKLGISAGKLEKKAFIGSDIRYSSDILRNAFISGFSSVGGSIIDIGSVSSPIISYLSLAHKILGVMITASHNPPSNNGFKFFKGGMECNEDFEGNVENLLVNEFKKTVSTDIDWKESGNVSYQDSKMYIEDFTNYITSKVNIKNTETKIVIDCVNNVPNLVSPIILERIGFKNIIKINEKLDPSFPGRPSEPVSENLQELKNRVISEKADIGIAHDGDGDRFAIIDETGNFVNSTALISFFTNHLDYSDVSKRKIFLTCDITQQAARIAEKKGGKVIITKIGRNKEYTDDETALFFAEPNKLIFPELGKWIDGLFPVLKLLEQMDIDNKSLSELLKPFDKRKVLRKAFLLENSLKDQLREQIFSLKEKWSNEIKSTSELDGLKINFTDDKSVLIRFSGTEPKVKFYFESNSQKENVKLLEKIKKELKLISEGIDC